MILKRVGILPSMEDEQVQHLHRAALVVSRDAHELPRWARAAVGHLQQEVGVHRLAEVGACVVWGSDPAAVARVALRNACATMLIVVARKPAKDGELDAALQRMMKAGSDVHVVTVGKRAKARAFDIGPDRVFRDVEDLTRPPQQQHAPALPPRKVQPVEPSAAPVMPRAEVPASEPSVAPVMPRAAQAPEAPGEAPSMPRAPEAPPAAPEAAEAATEAPAPPAGE